MQTRMDISRTSRSGESACHSGSHRNPWLESQITALPPHPLRPTTIQRLTTATTAFGIESLFEVPPVDVDEPAPEPCTSVVEAAMHDASRPEYFPDFNAFIEDIEKRIAFQMLDYLFQTSHGMAVLERSPQMAENDTNMNDDDADEDTKMNGDDADGDTMVNGDDTMVKGNDANDDTKMNDDDADDDTKRNDDDADVDTMMNGDDMMVNRDDIMMTSTMTSLVSL